MRFLDETGLAALWGKIKSYVDSKTSNLKSEQYKLVGKYNIPTSFSTTGDNQLITLPSYGVNSYENGMRILMKIDLPKTTFTGNFVPVMTSNSQNGFTIYEENAGSSNSTPSYNIADGNTGSYKTYGTSATVGIIFPKPIVIKKIKIHVKFVYDGYKGMVYGRSGNDTTTDTLLCSYTVSDASNKTVDKEFTITSSSMFDRIYFKCSGGTAYLAELNVTEYVASEYNPSKSCSINLEGLGSKPIIGTLEDEKKYELVYDGTSFNSTEV